MILHFCLCIAILVYGSEEAKITIFHVYEHHMLYTQ
jgi:hypothetical protein